MNNHDAPKISNVETFLQIINELSKSYPSHGVFNVPAATKFLFRGMSDVSYKLIPSIFRESITNFEDRSIHNMKYTSVASEKSILQSFIAEASAIIHNIPTTNLYQWAEYAQHFGVPTRFLDWSANPLVAMYFACVTLSNEDSVIWVLHLTNYQRYTNKKSNMNTSDATKHNKTNAEQINELIVGKKGPDYPFIYKPYYIDQRMNAQASYFLIWGNKTSPLEELVEPESWMELSNLEENGCRSFGSKQENEFILKIIIHRDRKQILLRQLDMLGINEKTMFPGLDGIGKYIERRFRFNYDEYL